MTYTGLSGCQLSSHHMSTSQAHSFSYYPQLEAFWKSFGGQNIWERTLFFGLWCLRRMHLRISAKAIQVALDGLQGIVTAFFSSLDSKMVKQNKHRHIEHASPDGGMVGYRPFPRLCAVWLILDEKRVLPSAWRCSAALASVFAPQIAAFSGPPPASSAAAQDVFYSGRKVVTLHRGVGHPFLNKHSSIWGKKSSKITIY